MWTKAVGLGLEEVTPSDVLLVDWDGTILAGSGKRHSEYPIHTEIVRARSDVKPWSTRICPMRSPLPRSTFLCGRSVTRRRFSSHRIPRFTLSGDLITTPELGKQLPNALRDRPAILLVHHGIVTVGPDIPTAVFRALLLERAGHQQLLAMAAGGPQTWSSDAEALNKREHCYGSMQLSATWELHVRPGERSRKERRRGNEHRCPA